MERRATTEEQSPSRPLELQEQSQRVRQAFAKLSESDRAILILQEFEECDKGVSGHLLMVSSPLQALVIPVPPANVSSAPVTAS